MISLFRKRIDLLGATTSEDEAGGAAVDWAVSETVWAGVERLSATRDQSGEGDRRLKRFAAAIRFREDISPGARVRFEAADYVVTSVEGNDPKDRRLRLICEEIPS